ncbi:MAG TPA: hypothetical protein PLJ12_14000, partial [Planctomycetota bacterium]|nr:hypothetical protein [Planctomycetota bacterium]
ERLLKEGSWLRQTACHEVLAPTASADPVTALPHMMGVHTYLTTWTNAPYIALDLVVHNGMDGLDPETSLDDLLDHLYFQRLSLELPVGWKVLTMFDNPLESPQTQALGSNISSLDLISPLPLGRMHILPRQARFMRRMMIVKDNPTAIAQAREVLNRRDLATLARPRVQTDLRLWTWWNPRTAFYFPQKFPLPALTDFDLPLISARLDQRFNEVSRQIAAGQGGTYPFTSPAFGWCHPWGEPYGGAPGGDEIHFVDGLRTLATENLNGYRLAEFAAKSYMDRQPIAFYNADGGPLRLRDLMKVDSQGRFYADCHFQLVPSGVHEFPRFDRTDKRHAQMVLALNLQPEYQDALLNWNPIDIQHLIRYTRNFKTLAWLGNDSIAKDELRLVAETYRLSYHELYSSPDGYVQGSGLLDKVLFVQTYPGKGVGVGRGEAWGMDAACAAYAFSGPEFRTRFRPWFEIFSRVLEIGQSDCTGNVQAFVIWNFFDGRYRIRQSFEVAMLEQSMQSIAETVFKGVNDLRYNSLRQVQTLSTYSSMEAPFWDPVQLGPWFTTATGSNDPNLIPDMCLNVPADARLDHVDFTDYWNAIAYSYVHTRDTFLRDRISIMLTEAQQVLGTDQLNYELRLEARAAMLTLMETPLP